MKKGIAVIVAAVAVIIVGFIVLIKSYITPEKVKTFLVSYAEQTLNRKIGAGEGKNKSSLGYRCQGLYGQGKRRPN